MGIFVLFERAFFGQLFRVVYYAFFDDIFFALYAFCLHFCTVWPMLFARHL
jgi:hypothetical protein